MAARKLVCVDLSDFERRKADIAASLLSAATDEGFFFVTGHGVSDADLQRMYALSRQFFTLPEDVKGRTRGPMSNPHYVLGYFSEELELGPVRQGFLCGAAALSPRRLAGLTAVTPHADPLCRRLQRTTTRAWPAYGLPSHPRSSRRAAAAPRSGSKLAVAGLRKEAAGSARLPGHSSDA